MFNNRKTSTLVNLLSFCTRMQHHVIGSSGHTSDFYRRTPAISIASMLLFFSHSVSISILISIFNAVFPAHYYAFKLVCLYHFTKQIIHLKHIDDLKITTNMKNNSSILKISALKQLIHIKCN